jgi:hypothetical protein
MDLVGYWSGLSGSDREDTALRGSVTPSEKCAVRELNPGY